MKIKLLPVLILLLSANYGFAQSTSTHAKLQAYTSLSSREKNKLKINTMLVPSIHIEAKKLRGGSRLIAQTRSTFVSPAPILYELSDTTHYYFKSNYGYDVTPEIFEGDFSTNYFYNKMQNYYDSSLYWYYDPGVGSLLLTDSITCEFTTNHKLSNRKDIYITFPVYLTNSHTYNSNELRTSELDSMVINTDTTVQRSSYTYNASNKLIYLKAEEWDTLNNVWNPIFADSFFYTGSNMSLVKGFTYDVVMASWIKSELYTLTYDVSNNLTAVLTQIWEPLSSAWIDDRKSDYLFNGSNQLLSSLNTNWDGSVWTPEYKDSFQYASGPYPSERIYQEWDPGTSVLVNLQKNLYLFNSLNQITEDNSFMWNTLSSGWDNGDKFNYYYENYTPQGLTETNAISGNLTLYPVPVGDVLHVHANWNESQSSTLTMTDMTGKIVCSIKCPASKQATQKIDVTSFKPGIYTITMKGAQGMMTQKFTKK